MTDAEQHINIADAQTITVVPPPPPRVGGAFMVGLTDDQRAPIAIPVHNPATGEPIAQINLEREEAITLASLILTAVAQSQPGPKLRMW